jgi:hypothetical protein
VRSELVEAEGRALQREDQATLLLRTDLGRVHAAVEQVDLQVRD